MFEVARVVAVAVAALVVYTRYSSRTLLTRDEAIFVYSAKRFTHGVAPYVSIWDPKTPGTSMLGGLAIELGHLVGLHAVEAIRLVFLATAVLTAVAVYLLGRVLWRSVLAAAVGAGVFLCFPSWAFEAFTGPDAKMPGVLAAVVSMALVVRRRWFSAAFAAALAFLFWQPLLVFAAAVLVAAALVPGRARWRALALGSAGFVVPVGAVSLYFVGVGAFGTFVDAAFVQPATGAQSYRGFDRSVELVSGVVNQYEHLDRWTFWIGIGVLLALAVDRVTIGRVATGRGTGSQGWLDAARDPLVCVVALTLAALLAFSVRDFQNYPDLDPLLPYPALGLGGLALRLRTVATRVSRAPLVRVAVPAVCAVLVLALLVTSVAGFGTTPRDRTVSLGLQRAQACALNDVAGPGTLDSLGDTPTLALTDRTNPDNFVAFAGGVVQWKLAHLPGGIAGWQRQISAEHPALITLNLWSGPIQDRMAAWLRRHYYRTDIGSLRVFLDPAARARARRLGIVVSPTPVLVDDRAELVERVGAHCAQDDHGRLHGSTRRPDDGRQSGRV